VQTQLPYALTVATYSLVMFVIAGYVKSAAIVLPIAIVGFIALMFFIRKFFGTSVAEEEKAAA
jgi:hypothetical protein